MAGELVGDAKQVTDSDASIVVGGRTQNSAIDLAATMS